MATANYLSGTPQNLRQPVGRERRGKGLRSRSKRLMYGAMLWASHMIGAQAAAVNTESPAPSPAKVQVNIEPLNWGAVGAPVALKFAVAQSDERLSPAFSRVSELLRLRQHNVIEQIRELQSGVGLDIELPDAGRLHLMLHPEEDKLGGGKRWAVTSIEDQTPDTNAVWSIGTSVDYVETTAVNDYNKREHKLSISPQLIIDADQLLGMQGDAVITLERAYWKSDRQIPTPAEQVVQLRLSWRF